MTEAEWLACAEPDSMVDYLQPHALLSDRKMRLFLVGRCRLMWHLLTDERSRKAVEMAERYADRQATRKELNTVFSPATAAALDLDTLSARCAWEAVTFVAWDGWQHHRVRRATDSADAKAGWAGLLRDIFANPFRPARFIRAWRSWNGGASVALAREMYEARDFGKAPLLADMLEDAGCSDPQILEHLRGPGPHVRGCWVVDLLLGKS